jgi:hypothetical protein
MSRAIGTPKRKRKETLFEMQAAAAHALEVAGGENCRVIVTVMM